jgi:RimJ/RimL family protein N-acetyltransferase
MIPWTPALPVVTERLELRVHRPDDIDDMLQFRSDPEVVRYVPWPISARADVEQALEKRLNAGRVDVVGDWLILAIVFRETGQVIGEVLLKNSGQDAAELGYALHRSFHGMGLAREAAEAMLGLGIRELGLRRITAELDERNTASAALLERLGFTLLRRFEEEFKGESCWALEYELRLGGAPSGEAPPTD